MDKEKYLFVYEFCNGYEAFVIAENPIEAKKKVLSEYKRLLNNFDLKIKDLKFSKKLKSTSCEIRFFE